MSIQRDDLIAGFWKQAPQRVGQATDLWLSVEGGDKAKLRELRRLLHTIKGEAQMLGLDEPAELLELAEDVVDELVKTGKEPRLVGDALLGGFEALGLAATAEEGELLDLSAVVGELKNAMTTLGGAEAPAPEPAPAQASPRPDTPEAAEVTQLSHEIRTTAATVGHAEGKVAAQATTALDIEQVQPLVHELKRLHGEQSLLLGELAEVQRRLRALLAEITPDASAELIRERIVKTLGYGIEVERRMGALRTMWSSNEFSTDRTLDQLADLIQRSAMLSTADLKSQVHRTARGAAKARGKDVAVEVIGEALVDPAIERTLRPCLLHLVRNAVDHGIEPADERRARGKPERGLLRVTFEQSESSVHATVEDDGGGIDMDALREVLKQRGADVAQLGEIDLVRSLFEHGVSTRKEADEISGRGVGLDVVARELAAIGGQVRVETIRGRGTKFHLTVPAMMKADVVVPVSTRSIRGAFPSRAVLRVVRVDEIEATPEGPHLKLGEAIDGRKRIRLHSLEAVLEASGEPRKGDIAVVLHGPQGPFAVTVDSFQNPRPVTFRRTDELPLRSPLVRGMSLLADGGVLLLLDVHAVHDAALGDVERGAPQPGEAPRRQRHVLVVEDAPVARELLTGLLRSFGLRVSEAVDGRDGLAQAKATLPDLVLTDIEMPYMDGIEMIRHLRNDPRLRNVPIIILTTRTESEVQARARELGVARFLSKRRFVESELREVITEALKARED